MIDPALRGRLFPTHDTVPDGALRLERRVLSVLGLHLKGMSVSEIAATLGVDSREIRKLKRLAKAELLYRPGAFSDYGRRAGDGYAVS